MNLARFSIIVVVAGLLAFFFASEIRRAALQREGERTQNFQPGHVSPHLTTPETIEADRRWRQQRKADEAERHEQRVAEIENNCEEYAIILWLVCAGIGFGLSRLTRRATGQGVEAD